MNDIDISMDIEKLGHRGDGVAAGGVFVAFALPGERVAGKVIDNRIAAPRILRASPDRAAPRCAHFAECGGCALQHASDAFLADWKRDRIAEALAARGLAADIRATVTSPPRSRRRATFSGRRTRKTVTLGFHARADARIVEIDDCPLLDPRILAARGQLAALIPFAASRKGEVKIAVTASPSGLDVHMRDARPLDGPARAQLGALAAQAGFARLSWDGETIALAHPPAQDFDGVKAVPPPGGFLQATPQGEAALRAAIRETIGDAARVIDLFAGCGTFALPLARRAEILAVENDAAALAALDAGWRAAGGALKTLRCEARDLFRRPLLPDEMRKYDAAIIDPPRAGAAAQMAEVAKSALPRIAAISCDPASFARDARILIDGGFALDWVQPVDQFLWSPHVEIAAAFSRR